jgi:hypothetical protein
MTGEWLSFAVRKATRMKFITISGRRLELKPLLSGELAYLIETQEGYFSVGR